MLAAAVILCGLGLSACAPESSPSPSTVPSSAPPAASESSEPPSTSPPAAFDADGDAAANLPIFTATVKDVWASEQRAQGRAYIDALVGAGFADKTAMQVTADRTTIGDPAESIQFSVLWKDQCLIGQVGPATGEPRTEVTTALAGGKCLLGVTRPIDW